MKSTGINEGPIVLFDGTCNVCNAAVQFIIRHDAAGKVRFAPLQWLPGAADGVAGEGADTMLCIDGGSVWARSDAALRIARHLEGWWRCLMVLRVIPRPVRDGAYRLVAKHRYRWFGQRPSCMMPSPDLNRRFLTDAHALAEIYAAASRVSPETRGRC